VGIEIDDGKLASVGPYDTLLVRVHRWECPLSCQAMPDKPPSPLLFALKMAAIVFLRGRHDGTTDRMGRGIRQGRQGRLKSQSPRLVKLSQTA
jgi:hypothetical protein